MTTKKLVVKITLKVIVYAIISTIAVYVLTNPIINNELALGQMENDNTLFLLMETYNRVKPFVSVLYVCVSCLFGWAIVSDVVKFVKAKTNKGEEKE